MDEFAEQRWVPRPINLAWGRHDEIWASYQQVREQLAPSAALDRALQAALPASEHEEVRVFTRGLDDRFDPGTGPEFYNTLLDHFETMYVNNRRIFERANRYERMDIVSIAEDVATDTQITAEFRHAIDTNNTDLIRLLLDRETGWLGVKAQQALTRTGRNTRLTQARKVIQLLGNKAAAHRGNPVAENQVVWCVALLDELESIRF